MFAFTIHLVDKGFKVANKIKIQYNKNRAI